MKFTFGKNGMLKLNGPSRKSKAKRKEALNKKIEKRRKWIEENPQLAEYLRKKRVKDYLSKSLKEHNKD